MTSTFTATLKIKVTHDKGTFIDTNSVLGLVGTMVSAGRNEGVDRLCEVGDKTEGTPEGVEITLSKCLEGRDEIELDDFETDYIYRPLPA